MPEKVQDLYFILQVHPKADVETINLIYRFLARKYHPDTAPANQKALFEDRMKRINAAHEILSDIRKREEYDATTTSENDLDSYAYKFHLAAKLSEVGSAGGSAKLCYEQSCGILSEIASGNSNSETVRCEALARIADIQIKGLQQYPAAAETYQKLLSTATNIDRSVKDHLLWKIAECYNEAQSFDKALTVIERLITETSDADSLNISEFAKAGLLHRARRCEEAVTAYQQYARKYLGTPEAARSLFSAARILDSDLNRWQEAIAGYKVVLTTYPHSPEAGDCQWRIDHIQRKYIEKKGWWEA